MEIIRLINDTIKEWEELGVTDDALETLEYVRDHLIPAAFSKELDDINLQLDILEGEMLLEEERLKNARENF